MNPNVLPCGIICGLKIEYVSGHEVRIKPGFAYNDGGGRWPIQLDEDLIIDIEQDLDTGSEQTNQFYYVWLITSKYTNNIKGLFSLSSTDPILPEGYSPKRRIGVVRNDNNGDFLNFYMEGSRIRNYLYQEDIGKLRLLSGGSATNWTPIDCSSLIPPVSRLGYFEFAQVNSGITAWFGVNGLSTKMRFIKNNGVSVSWLGTDDQQKIEYMCNLSSAATYLDVMGFSDEV